LDIAWKTWANHQGKLRPLYEQGVSATDIGQYVERWMRWVRSGVEIVDGWYEGWVGESVSDSANRHFAKTLCLH